ncbi:MAG: tRNA (adenosine(37)-N6)-threonylcarbamoyltransferase complex ATPase subunit type 1 TsaE [Candidatus Omnitrophica bacterium]|nr:tRNA (adenosine(37)-N6)-threonylcarbamoyltransferase complex ATPase subunit type 1 TsaE [Candidatus Omnitrophota bacterium]
MVRSKTTIFLTDSPADTRAIGEALARKLRRGDMVHFCGGLGSGKTTMIQGIVRALTGHQATSPSFVIINEYPGKVPIYHFDFYRLTKPEELESIGWKEYADQGIILIEWADRFPELGEEARFIVTLSVLGRRRRSISVVEFKKNR